MARADESTVRAYGFDGSDRFDATLPPGARRGRIQASCGGVLVPGPLAWAVVLDE